jgi:D-lactate dehydrogenase
MFGPIRGSAGGAAGVQASFEQLAARAGIALLVPPAIDGLCCGTPWSSKGLATGKETMRERTAAALREATRDGELPIVCDASSCTEGLLHAVGADGPGPGQQPLRIIDVVEFTAEHILPSLPPGAKLPSLALHPTCSSTRMGLNPALTTVAQAVADRVDVPEDWGCCAFAGDRGMLHPELTASATERQAREVNAFGSAAHASCNRTCELGMTRATGHDYRHVLELLAEAAAD